MLRPSFIYISDVSYSFQLVNRGAHEPLKDPDLIDMFKSITSRRRASKAPVQATPTPQSAPNHALAVDLRTSGIPPHPQDISPLFSILPPEIRNRIFHLTLLEYDDESSPVPFDSYGYRPGHEYRKKHSLDLLATCKRAYLEAYLIPIAATTHTTWGTWSTRAPLNRSLLAYHRFQKMNVEQRAAVETVQLYAQQFALEALGWESEIITKDEGTHGVLPRRLIISVRHSDWWEWELDTPLCMDELRYGISWRESFKSFPSLEEFVMELETLERRKAEMDIIAEGVRKWRIDIGNGRVLKTDGIPLKTCTWNGSTILGGGLPPPEGATSLPYYVVTITWKVQNV